MKRRELKLTFDERVWLEQFTNRGSVNHQAFKRAQILLAADKPKPIRDAELAKAIGVSEATIYNTRRRYLVEGVERAVHRKARKTKAYPRRSMVALKRSSSP
jgi:hypothetical protein